MFSNAAKTAVLRELTARANMPMPGLFISPEAQPNAFATGRNPEHAAVAIAASLIQMAISRNREFEADRTGANLAGSGEPLARALLKLDASAKQVPMNIAPAQASHFIVNLLAGRRGNFQNLFRTHPPTEQRVARLLGAAAS